MKKFILVMVSAIIMTVFITLNYLLWDRENNIKSLENLNASKNASIDAYSRELDINRQLRSKISELEETNKTLQSKYGQLEQERAKLKDTLDQKNENMNKLKQQADMKPLEAIVRQWVESIDVGQYQAAFELQKKLPGVQDRIAGLNEFTNNYKAIVKNMKLKTIILAVEGMPDDKKGEIVFKVELDVKKGDNDPKNQFADGVNIRFFTFAYEKEKSDWVIADVASVP